MQWRACSSCRRRQASVHAWRCPARNTSDRAHDARAWYSHCSTCSRTGHVPQDKRHVCMELQTVAAICVHYTSAHPVACSCLRGGFGSVDPVGLWSRSVKSRQANGE